MPQRADRAATKTADGTEVPEQEIAIKKVLQDKRFKVSLTVRMKLTGPEP